MKICEDISEFKRLENGVITSGTFDGVHLGHQKILKRLTSLAQANGGESVLITFWPHPRSVLYPEQSIRLLNTFEEKADLLRKQGLDHIIKIPFTHTFSQLSSNAFIKDILVEKIGTKSLVIGYDHKFGKNREGSFIELKKNAPNYGFEVEEIPKLDLDHVGISSSKIRKSLLQGQIHISNQYLGWEYSITGKVIEGQQLGRSLGFPTANIEVNSIDKLIPSDGAYAVRVNLNGVLYPGMLNIGVRPTVNGSRHSIEVHIFDFNKNIYNENITINFVRLLRNERKFSNLDELKSQLALDMSNALRYLQ